LGGGGRFLKEMGVDRKARKRKGKCSEGAFLEEVRN